MNTFGERIRNLRTALGLSQEDLADLLGYSDKPSISKIENDQRNITRSKIVEFAGALKTSPSYLMGWTDDPVDYSRFGLLPVEKRKIPVIGNVHCGKPEFAEEDYLDIVESDINADYALKAKGDSMIGAGIEENDLVFVKKQPSVKNGELAVILLNDEEAAIKRVYKYDNYISLNAENPAYDPLIFHDGDSGKVEILGRVVAHLHYYKERKR